MTLLLMTLEDFDCWRSSEKRGKSQGFIRSINSHKTQFKTTLSKNTERKVE